MTAVVLPGERLVEETTALRPWRDSDAAGLVAACRDPEIARWTRVPDDYGPADARAYLLHRYDVIQAGTTAPFAIVSIEDRLLGSISLINLDWTHRRGEVGYWLAAEARGDGHTTRALRLICRWGFDSLGLERISLFAALENQPSQRVGERADFVREALLRSYMRGKHGQLDMIAYGLLADEL